MSIDCEYIFNQIFKVLIVENVCNEKVSAIAKVLNFEFLNFRAYLSLITKEIIA